MSSRSLMITLTLAGALSATLAGGCARVVSGQPVSPASTDQALIAGYFEHSNAAAKEGTQAQQEFLKSTQHPDFPDVCGLGGLTILLDPALGSLHSDSDWHPAKTDRTPRGRIYAVAVTLTVQRDKSTIGTQVGQMHVVVLDGTAYGFSPCPA